MSLKTKTAPPGKAAYIKGGLFGPPGTGKTTAACSGTNTLLLEFEPQGDCTTPLRGRKDVDVYKPSNWKETAAAIEDLYGADRETWDFLAVDSVTFMQQLFGGKDILKAYVDNKDVRRPYGQVGAAVNQLIHDMALLPMHVIFVCQMKHVEAPEDGSPRSQEHGEYAYIPDLTPMVYKTLTPVVSLFGRTYKKSEYVPVSKGSSKKKVEVVYGVSFNDSGTSPAKNRLGLPDKVRGLDLNDLAKQLKETQ